MGHKRTLTRRTGNTLRLQFRYLGRNYENRRKSSPTGPTAAKPGYETASGFRHQQGQSDPVLPPAAHTGATSNLAEGRCTASEGRFWPVAVDVPPITLPATQLGPADAGDGRVTSVDHGQRRRIGPETRQRWPPARVGLNLRRIRRGVPSGTGIRGECWLALGTFHGEKGGQPSESDLGAVRG